MIDIKGLDKAKVLKALYDNSRPQGVGVFVAAYADELTEEKAAELLKDQTYFDYLSGRVMKVHLDGDELDPRLYDRDLGEGAAARAIESIKRRTFKDTLPKGSEK